MNVLILAGGSGTRLWPASRQKKPKQLLPFLGSKTLLQNTYGRFLKFTKPSNIYIGTLTTYAPVVRKQLPQIPKTNYSLEPVLRDRGPAIGLAALLMNHHDPNSAFVTAWSDHYIKEEGKYLQILRKAEKYLRENPRTTVTVGVTPKFAHPGLGYIEQGSIIKNRWGLKLHAVKSFKEKPSLALAQKYLAANRYLWNAAYFIWRTDYLLELYRTHLPEIYNLLMQIKPALGTARQQTVINRIYPKMPAVDIETALIERVKNRVVITADFEWADIGSWRTIKEVLSPKLDNLTKGLWLGVHTSDSLIYNYTDKLVATAGMTNSVVIVTDEVVLVADKNNTNQIRELIKLLEKSHKLKKYL